MKLSVRGKRRKTILRDTARRLAAIIAVDVVGYSRLVADDEEATISLWRDIRFQLTDPLIDQHGGRIVNTAGDSLLIEFPSVVEAFRCGVSIQEGIGRFNADVPPDRQLLLRMGLNLGDVIDADGDLLGDGVNIAARLEALAPPGGLLLSRAVRDHLRDKTEMAFDDLGERKLKNISRPVHVFAAAVGVMAAISNTSGSKMNRYLKHPVRWVAVISVVLLVGVFAVWIANPDYS